MKKRILIYIVVTQLIIIFTLIYAAINKENTPVNNQISINTIDRQEYVYSKIDGLKYFYEPKPNVTQRIRLGWENTYGPENPTYTINSDGFNQLNNFTLTKPKKTYRILTLGDSFTFGENVDTKDNYPSKLQAMLNKKCTANKFEVTNLGVGGYDMQYSVERYKLRGQKYNPDLILWLVVWSDLERVDEVMIPASQANQEEFSSTGKDQKDIANNIYYSAWLKARRELEEKMGGRDNLVTENVNKMKELDNYYKGNLFLFSLSLDANDSRAIKNYVEARPKGYFKEEIADIYNKKGAVLPDKHPSPLGYNIIVQNIFNQLTKNKLIPCT